MTAQEWYEQGNAFRKESKWHEAINCYIQAIGICIIPDDLWER